MPRRKKFPPADFSVIPDGSELFVGPAQYSNGQPMKSGHCNWPVDSQPHNGVACPITMWQKSRNGWAWCVCPCHEVDIQDEQFLRECAQERAAQMLESAKIQYKFNGFFSY